MRRLAFPLILGLGGAAILVALGVWQVQRLGEKAAYIAAIEARIGDTPVALPPAPDPEADGNLAVAVSGRYGADELLVLAGPKGLGPGYRVIVPFETAEGRRILVDRGFVREADKGQLRPGGAADLVGNLQWPDETDAFTPDPDPGGTLWFARDVPAMAETLGTEPVLLVVRQTSQTGLPVTPLPVDTSTIPNDHLEYAVTWFGLAAVWLGMTVFLIRRTLRRPS